MVASPWKQFKEMVADREYLVMASHLPLAHMSATPRFLGFTSSVRRQLAETPGIVGYTLDAKVFAKDYFTLSVWDDDAALRAFVARVPHADVMTKLAPDMGQTRFVTWTVTGPDARPTWAEAKQRLA